MSRHLRRLRQPSRFTHWQHDGPTLITRSRLYCARATAFTWEGLVILDEASHRVPVWRVRSFYGPHESGFRFW